MHGPRRRDEAKVRTLRLVILPSSTRRCAGTWVTPQQRTTSRDAVAVQHASTCPACSTAEYLLLITMEIEPLPSSYHLRIRDASRSCTATSISLCYISKCSVYVAWLGVTHTHALACAALVCAALVGAQLVYRLCLLALHARAPRTRTSAGCYLLFVERLWRGWHGTESMVERGEVVERRT